jgi:hypothetical protein
MNCDLCRLFYREHMKRYADETAALSFTKYDHPDYQAILEMGWAAVPYLLEDIQSQHPDGGWTPGERTFSFWSGISLLAHIVGDKRPLVPQEDRGRLAAIRKLWVEWGIKQGYITKNDPKIPMRWDQLHRFAPDIEFPKKYQGLQNFLWRLTTLPNKHRMKHSWDYWRAF